MKLKQNQLYAFLGISVLLSLGIFTQLDNSSANAFVFQLPQLSLVDQTGYVYYDIWCFSNNAGYLRDSSGSVVVNLDPSSPSAGFSQVPTLSVIADEKDVSNGTILINNMLRCNQGIENLDGNDSISQEEIDNAKNSVSLDVQGHYFVNVYSRDNTGKFIKTVEKEFTGSKTTLTNGGAKNMGFTKINVSDIEKNLPTGTYESYQKIEVTGLITIEPTGSEWDFCKVDSFKPYQCKWVYAITSESDDPQNAQLSWLKLNIKATGDDPTEQELCEGKLGYEWKNNECVKKQSSSPEDLCNAKTDFEWKNNTCVLIDKGGDEEPELDDFGLLDYKLFLQCLDDGINSTTGGDSCLNDVRFIGIYAIIGTMVLLGVMQSVQQSRVIRLES